MKIRLNGKKSPSLPTVFKLLKFHSNGRPALGGRADKKIPARRPRTKRRRRATIIIHRKQARGTKRLQIETSRERGSLAILSLFLSESERKNENPPSATPRTRLPGNIAIFARVAPMLARRALSASRCLIELRRKGPPIQQVIRNSRSTTPRRPRVRAHGRAGETTLRDSPVPFSRPARAREREKERVEASVSVP